MPHGSLDADMRRTTAKWTQRPSRFKTLHGLYVYLYVLLGTIPLNMNSNELTLFLPSFAQAKLAIVVATKEVQRRHQRDGVTAVSV